MTSSASSASSTSLTEGTKAPQFSMKADGNSNVSLSDFKGKNVVLYFYPKDDTPGCTTESKDFAAAAESFDAANTVILGISRDSVASHDKFKAKYCLPFPLLSDEEGKTCEAYGVWVEKSMYGKKYMGIERSTFLIDATGTLRRIWRKVSVTNHVNEVLSAIKSL